MRIETLTKYCITYKQPRLVIHYKNFITIENHITSTPHCSHGCHHNLLMHEFYHCSTKVINLMFFFFFFGGLPRAQTKGLIPSYSSMGQCYCNKCKIVANCTTFFSPHNLSCNLGNNTFTLVQRIQFLVLSIPTNFEVIPIPILHINSNIIVNFFVKCILSNRIPSKSKLFIFPSTSLQILHFIVCKLPFDLRHNLAHCSFVV
jgi:hypothetical protein